jgi:hypothetical protein
MIKFQDMTKDQKQKVILGVIVGAAAIIGIKQFVVGPMIANRGKSGAEYEALRLKIDSANTAIRNEPATAKKLEESRQALVLAGREHIPSSDNQLAWATKTIYTLARGVGVDIESVSETETDAGNFTAKEQTKLAFKPYAVRIAMQCSYAQLSQLVKALEDSNPHLCIVGIQVSAQPAIADRHQIGLVVEWPSWKDPARAKPYLEAGGDHA